MTTNAVFSARALSALSLSTMALASPLTAATETDDIMVVTATQTEQAIEDVNASIEVISRTQIDQFSGRSLSEVLQQAAGLSVKDSGSSSFISIRGFDDDHSLILVDGLRRTEKYAGSNVNNISLQNIERIEIVRGPMSALYGSDALGGVINIITRAPEQSETQLRLNAGGADNDAGRESLILHANQDWALDTSAHSLGLEYKQRNPYQGDNGSLNEEQRAFVNYRGRFELDSDSQLVLGAEYLDQDDKNAAPTTGRFESEQRYQLNSSYRRQLGNDQLALELGYGRSDARVNRGSGDETTDFRQTQSEVRYSGQLNDSHLYTLGTGYRNDDVDISINTRNAERQIYHAFAQDQWQLTDQLDLTLGLRYDDYSDFGSTTNPRLSLAWTADRWKLRAGYGTAFRAPSLIQMYSSFTRRTSVINGNPALQPEDASTYELSARYQLDNGALEVTLFHSDVEQLIAAQVDSTSGTCPGRSCIRNYLYGNIDEATLKGVETSLNWTLSDHHQLRTSIDYLDARDSRTQTRLTGRARWQGKLSLASDFGDRWSSTLRLRYSGDFYDTPGRPVSAYNSHFTTVDINAQYQLSDDTYLFAGIDNLADREMPANMETHGTPADPGSRYVYAGIDIRL